MEKVAALDLIDKYYVGATNKQQDQYPRGHIYWCPCCYFDEETTILRPRGTDPYGKKPPLFETQKVDPRRFNDPVHPPVLRPKLEADEEFLVLRAKNRPVIVLSSQSQAWRTRDGRERIPCMLVAPVYSFHEDDPAEWKLWMRALRYPDLFWLPQDDTVGMQESFVRFDRIHVVPQRWLRRKGVRLHQDALDVLTDWFRFYLTAEPDYLEEHRGKLLRAVQEQLTNPGN
ncbi:MAG: hypothetical protein WCD51_08735 [Anaerolineae bacterium]